MTRKFLIWISIFGAAGLLIPAEVLLRWAVTRSSITTIEWCLWPSAIWCMATEVPNAGDAAGNDEMRLGCHLIDSSLWRFVNTQSDVIAIYGTESTASCNSGIGLNPALLNPHSKWSTAVVVDGCNAAARQKEIA
jgi:hypothetical protein